MSLMNTYSRVPLSFSKGDGVYLYNQKGEKFLDFMSGIGVNALGYNHPSLLNAMHKAMQKPLHVSNLYEIPEQEELATLLCKNSPFHRAFFCNSGTEANEGAIKLVRKFYEGSRKKKTKIISFSSSFHGRTMGSLALTAKDSIKKGFTPLIGDTQILRWNSCEDLEKFVDEEVAGIFIEPIQGEGGVNIPHQKFLEKIKEVCKKFDILLVADEVQTGIGRTGKKFAFEHFFMEVDVVCLAKGLGGGVPIGAILATKEVSKVFTTGTHGSTFGGNPFVCTVANAVCREIFQERFLSNVYKLGEYILKEIKMLQKNFPAIIENVRGKGLMIGIETRDLCQRDTIIKKFLQKNVLVLSAGEKTVRLLPPLIIKEEDIKDFKKIFMEILKTL